ncbi:uncharacterized protein LOC110112241 isoform X1 [Dendrobium catenatum]|uniref:uncharacterized protein LOC110112241 isoform X1 n=1 Tax=Dendrobium catenatum TaxID=906689 RepID=UPI0009F647A9|nr:uncharacterized protein LOC110112241 isoform X1 [Dendrobium catenatum]XP_020700062.1 uncharacterized protein LOC110112241 isoform X1 [Dendrobium catenatum]XP_020700071.1 uncharacterized protein LOC110112241 isoform X1 [Dendrobium catenatum]XP_020700077.1 uncharacterized protein LOC110112241 isoform X1 [Dendrobium catenatum]XP_028549787.1 uncharacterized protein LOC110112241 isoform X1 [Dendrobium catenatum]XP_028549788.1 uncharacterized protein LOC110112241 isoform X1 [Dendrobium catenatum]
MMSDHAAQTNEQGEGLGVAFSDTNANASSHPYMGKGMARWIQACRSSSSKGWENHNAALVGNVVDQFKEHDFLAVERVKIKEVKLLSFDMNQRYSGGYVGKLSSTAENVDLVSHFLQSDETIEGGWKNFRITDKSSTRRDLELFDDEITFFERVSAESLAESSLKWKASASYQFQNIDANVSDFEHFPMFEINKKMETIMASRKKSTCGSMFVKMKKVKLPVCESTATSSFVELTPGSWHAANNMIDNTENAMRPCEGFQPNYAYKVPENTNLSWMKRKLWCCFSNNKFITAVSKNNIDSMPTSFGILWKSSKDGSTLVFSESNPNDFPCHSSTEEQENSIKDESSHRWLVGQKRLSQPDDSDTHLWPSKIPKCQMQDVSQPRSCRTLKSVGSGEGFHRLSSPINSLLVVDEMGLDHCHRELMMGDSGLTHINDNALSEKFITPTNQNYGQKEITIVPFVNVTSVEGRRGPGGIGTHFMGEDKESFTKAGSVYHSPHRSSSLLGKPFSRPPTVCIFCKLQCVASPNLRKCNCTSPSLAAEAPCRNIETGTTDGVEQHPSTERTTSASVERTVDFSGSNNLVKTRSTWVKRLQHNQSETLTLCTKMFKKCVDSSSELQNMSSSRMHNRSMEDHKCDRTMTFSENDSPSTGDTEKALQAWIRRWRCNHSQAASPTALRPVASVAFQPSENFEGKKFASIGAMALMGKAINNYKPCRIRRKDASLVWTI